MNRVEQVVANLEQWQVESGRTLPRSAEAIMAVESDCVVDLLTGDVERLADDWQVFAQIWKTEREQRWLDVSYCALAVALRKADSQRTISAREAWADYLKEATMLLVAVAPQRTLTERGITKGRD